jgi:hypothetical protein
MIRDTFLQSIFIPLLGILIPMVSGIVTYNNYSVPALIAAHLFFILTSFIIWKGCNWIHIKLRPLFKGPYNPFVKITSISLVSSLYGASSGGVMTMIWFRMAKETFEWEKLIRFCVFTSLAVLLFTLIYEILFLSREREIDSKIVKELDRELTEAEKSLLQNEMDPHFIFNALNTLNHLIVTSPKLAHIYNKRLAEVYKYFLVNKKRELVSLEEEIEFIEN